VADLITVVHIKRTESLEIKNSHQCHANHVNLCRQDIIREPQDSREYRSVDESDETCGQSVLNARVDDPDKNLQHQAKHWKLLSKSVLIAAFKISYHWEAG